MTPKTISKKKYENLKDIRDEVLNLTSSPLYSERIENGYFPVIGEGNHDAQIMYIGEAPGKNEAETGRPFCGRAGKVLDELLNSIGIERTDVYITNILKDRPPGNRDPLPNEVEIYAPFLDRQIEIIQPKVIATLGRHSMSYVFKKYGLDDVLAPISKIHGKVFDIETLFGGIKLIALYHPAVAVYDSNQISVLKNDFEILKDLIV
jgi:DNA polymerase